MMQETCLGSYDLGVAEKNDCNCYDKNGRKHYDDQHQI